MCLFHPLRCPCLSWSHIELLSVKLFFFLFFIGAILCQAFFLLVPLSRLLNCRSRMVRRSGLYENIRSGTGFLNLLDFNFAISEFFFFLKTKFYPLFLSTSEPFTNAYEVWIHVLCIRFSSVTLIPYLRQLKHCTGSNDRLYYC